MKKQLFDTFAPVSKTDWLAKIEKDLKGKPIADLTWQFGSLAVEPFGHPDDAVAADTAGKRPDNDWLLGEDFFMPPSDFAAANRDLLAALMHGTNAPCLHLSAYPMPADMSAWLHEVSTEYIELNFDVTNPESPAEWLGSLSAQATGCLFWRDADTASGLQLLAAARSAQPRLRVLGVAAPLRNEEHLPAGIANMLTTASAYLAAADSVGLTAKDVNAALHFEVQVGVLYFPAIAAIRALRMLWANVLEAYGLPADEMPPIHARLLPQSQTSDTNSNMIRATTQAMSAAIGGAQRITLMPTDTHTGTVGDFARRIARNVQHLLKMESHLDDVIDPAHGSYYIEQLTRLIADDAWAHFLEKQEA